MFDSLPLPRCSLARTPLKSVSRALDCASNGERERERRQDTLSSRRPTRSETSEPRLLSTVTSHLARRCCTKLIRLYADFLLTQYNVRHARLIHTARHIRTLPTPKLSNSRNKSRLAARTHNDRAICTAVCVCVCIHIDRRRNRARGRRIQFVVQLRKENGSQH